MSERIKSVAQPLKAGSEWRGQKVVLLTTLCGKRYYWLRDVDGVYYLAKVGADGQPDLT